MAVIIRLKRMGTTKKPHFRVVVTDQRSPRDGRFIEELGYYKPRTDPAVIELDKERVGYWLSTGAQVSSSVKSLLKKAGVAAAR